MFPFIRKLGLSHVAICRQLSKMNISCYRREKTPKYSEKQAEKAKNLVMVWVAISNRGISKPLFRPSKSEVINSDILINESLFPFILEHHLNSNCNFWPDLAVCWLPLFRMAWMDENVNFVPKDINPPNVP